MLIVCNANINNNSCSSVILKILQDGCDEFFVTNDMKVYWVLFLNGLQRTMLFTEDKDIALNAVQVNH